MNKKKVSKMSRDELIQEINVLGPWVHGYFDLGNDLIIEDQDTLQRKRLFATRDYLVNIISNHYKRENLGDKTLCDIGCNTGYFLYELYKKFQFKEVIGLEPRVSNLQKAQFIANFFKLPKDKYKLRKFDILAPNKHLPVYDIVIMPGVLHHLDNHLNALQNIYKMTRDICIIETQVLADTLNTSVVATQLELKDKLYKISKNQDRFGIIGYKLESDRLDGATVHSGIVGIPTTETLVMMLRHVGFDDVMVFKSERQLKNNIYNEKSYREFHAVIVMALKHDQMNSHIKSINTTLDKIEEKEFSTYLPLKYIEPLYSIILGESSLRDISEIPKLIYYSEIRYKEKIGRSAATKLQKKIRDKAIYDIIRTFKHAPAQKIAFEFAKTCFHQGLIQKSLDVATKLINTVNLDWRMVYSTYHLLALLNYTIGNKPNARLYNNLALRAHPPYSLALKLKRRLDKR